MKITVERLRDPFEFLDEHGLEIVVREVPGCMDRLGTRIPPSWTASLRPECEWKASSVCLSPARAVGYSAAEAVANLLQRMGGNRLTLCGAAGERKDIPVPGLTVVERERIEQMMGQGE